MNEIHAGPASPDVVNSVLDDLVDELTAKLQACEPVDLEEYTRQYPEHAERLRKLLPALALVADLGQSMVAEGSSASNSRSNSVAGLGELGDFRILREVGRGGMGVVYEAEQRSLCRRVALKVLPFAATLDSKQLQRFKLEAQATAYLHHNNIVPVFAVGTEGGVPFYAMQFIEGRSLAEVIHELRSEGLDRVPVIPGGAVESRLADPSTTALARSLVSGEAATPQSGAPGPRAIAPYWVIWRNWANAISAACCGVARVEESAHARSPCRAQHEVCSDARSLRRPHRSTAS